jgi:negative regulator of genetic competence, sporulation and motility
MDESALAASRIFGTYLGANTLYKYGGRFYLILDAKNHGLSIQQENILKEYGRKFSQMDMSKAFLLEYGEVIISDNAIGTLVSILG